MSEYLIQDTTLTEIANAIRSKTGETASINVSDMANKISGINTSANISCYEVSPSADDGFKSIVMSKSIIGNVAPKCIALFSKTKAYNNESENATYFLLSYFIAFDDKGYAYSSVDLSDNSVYHRSNPNGTASTIVNCTIDSSNITIEITLSGYSYDMKFRNDIYYMWVIS